jgi:acetolactate synthase-1/2/3 large subunit
MGRTGGEVLVSQLGVFGVDHIFCVPGESYLAALDALHDAPIELTVCRQEGGAAMMAEAYGKLTGRPGVCFVTRGPGATNAASGVHVAMQDSTPLVLLVGQAARGVLGREAFQELDYRAVFGGLAKWATEVDDADRLPEVLSRAFHVATNGRPGPVVIALPEDVLTDVTDVTNAPPYFVSETAPKAADLAAAEALLAGAARPLVIAGGSRWGQETVDRLVGFAERRDLPVAVSFRRQSLFPATHPNYAGDLAVGANAALVAYANSADVVLLLGTRLSEIASQDYTILGVPSPRQKLIHVHPDAEELGRVYRADVAINTSPRSFLEAASALAGRRDVVRQAAVSEARLAYLGWSEKPTDVPGDFNLGEVFCQLRDELPSDAIVTNGAGNYAGWLHRFYRFTRFGTQLAPTSGSMGYGLPAAVAASRLDPSRRVVAFAGDGCFMMTSQEFATAVQYDLPVIVVVIDNSMYGTIRMHQERHYPGRTSGTTLRNPDFAAMANAFGGHGETVCDTEDFIPAFKRAVASGKPSIIHCITDPQALTPGQSLDQIAAGARARQAGRG